MKRVLRILGIETSCDETAAAVVEICGQQGSRVAGQQGFAFHVLSSVVASQVKIHAKYGGVVPEVAAREHVAVILPVIQEAIAEIPSTKHQIPNNSQAPSTKFQTAAIVVDAIAVTAGPGLITSLSVGVETARTLAYAWKKPLIAINHIEGHVMSALLPKFSPPPGRGSERGRATLRPTPYALHLRFPALALIVSGGHTELLLMRGWGRYECIGATRDDAAGEAFDKVGKLLGLPYPGGPAVARTAEDGDPKAFDFPRGMLHSKDYEFSFSGLKTAVRYHVERRGGAEPVPSGGEGSRTPPVNPSIAGDHVGSPLRRKEISDICASFQQAAVDVLAAKAIAAAQQYRVKTILLGGGVAANTALRARLGDAVRTQLPDSLFLIPDSRYTSDNAAMIAAAGGVRLLIGESMRWQELDVDANWELGR